MKIEFRSVAVRDLFEGFHDNDIEGVVGYGGKLDIRPPYQREFIYKDAQRNAVIHTVLQGFPLNVMYWAKVADDKYEILDGQQRTLSICQFLAGRFSLELPVGTMYFKNLPDDMKERILNYKLTVYVCDGTPSEKLDWFRTINIAGEKLTEQELKNASFAGPWTTAAKKYFSKVNCPAYGLAKDYMKGTPIRQDYLETVLGWIANKHDETIDSYMGRHQFDTDINELKLYFNSVINWVEVTFPKVRSEMKNVEWGVLFNQYGQNTYNTANIEAEVAALMEDEDVTRKSGIYEYLLSSKSADKERLLSIRAFTPRMKREAYERQKGICPHCNEHFELSEMEADHITPWSQGGRTVADNCQMLCKPCNRIKSNN